MPSKRQLTVGAGYVAAAAVYIALTWPQLLGIGAIIGTGLAVAFTSRLEFGRRSWAAIRSKTSPSSASDPN